MGVRYGSASVRGIARILREEGPLALLHSAASYGYNRLVWPYLPTVGYVTYAGIQVEERKLLDAVVPFETPGNQPDLPDHEPVLAPAIRENVSPGDDVVEVGGGYGATAAIAADRAGPEGSVTTYEGSAFMVRRIRRTAALEGIEDRVTVRHALVSGAVRLMMEDDGTTEVPVVPVEDLPACDVLVVDCDGCELDVLEALDGGPDVVIVEHHAVLDSDVSTVEYRPDAVRRLLEDPGYDVVDAKRQDLDEDISEFGEEEIVYVAVRRDGDST